ncbi:MULTISPECIES: mechanosensitive ion channel family protein [Flammeovirga]|uniref:Mechanosensitive ion channel family protein n=1 Tax=Flammeovirga agarivorans TaxID=2726742 RepID=A0A7X8SMQ6_9BACT|nr:MULTISPECIES: mechanosensitive ion channel family protein [Flammeovirga]NLR93010.1 mechanosensitive ion channel family protein [Flammeovirga agarivorans]
MSIKQFLIYVIVFLFPFITFGEENDDQDGRRSYPEDHLFYDFKSLDSIEYSLSTPYHTIHTHLENLEEDNFHPEVAIKAFPQGKWTEDELRRLAIQLKLIYFREGIYLNSINFPLEKDYIDKKTQTHRYFISSKINNIYLDRQENGEWRYSEYSTNRINELFKDSYPSFTSNLVLFASSIQQSEEVFMGINLWQWTSIFLLIIMTYIYYRVGEWISKKFLKRIFSKLKKQEIDNLILPKFRLPLATIIICAFWYYLIPFLLLSEYITYYIMTGVKLLFIYNVFIILYHLADVIVIRFSDFIQNNNVLDKNLLPVLKACLRIIFITFGVLLALKIFGFDISRLITGISFGGVALAFAAQDTVKNFFGSIMIFLDKPFQVGDWVSVQNQEGIIEEIGFRSTRVRTFTDSLLSIPNGVMVNSNIDNLGQRKLRRYNTMLSIPYNTPTVKIEAFIEEVKKCIEAHPKTKKDLYHVRLNNLAAASLEVMLYVYFETFSWTEELENREALLFDVLKAAERVGVEFAFPTQTLYVKNDDDDHQKKS